MSRANPRYRRPNNPLPVPINNVYQLSLLGETQGQLTVTTFYYVDANPVGSFLGQSQLISAFITNVLPSYENATTVLWNGTAIVVRVLSSPQLGPTLSILPAGTAGVVPGATLGTIPSVTIDRQTAYAGQTGRGHISMPAVPATFVAPNSATLLDPIPAAYTTLANNAFLQVIVFAGDTFTPALASRGTRLVPKKLGAAVITQTRVQSVLGTTRRRKIGRGK